MNGSLIKGWVVDRLAEGFHQNIYGIKFLLASAIRVVWKKGFAEL
jgi:hypothetical protein